MLGRCLLGCLLVVAIAQPAVAQSEGPLAFDVNIGLGVGDGTAHNYHDRESVSAEITLMSRAPMGAWGRIAGGSIGGQANPASGDKCAFESPTDHTCAPKLPGLAHVSALVGLERRSPQMSVRMLGGPAVFGGTGAPGLGTHLQVDAALGWSHIAFVVAARGNGVLRSHEALVLGSVGLLGLRLQ